MSDQRKQVVRTAVSLLEAGLVSGTAGNVSLREVGTGCFLITPSAVNYRVMGEQDIVQVDLVSGSVKGPRRPSTERELHRQIYTMRADVNAVIHYHSPYATAVAVARKTIPHILDEGIDLTPIPTVEYCPAGSPELASEVAAQLAEGRNAVLLANHGAVVVGENLQDALNRSREVERLAQIYVWAETLGGAVPLEAWAVARSQEFLTQYRKAMAAGATLQPSQAADDSESLSLADLVRFSVRSWVTFGSLIHTLVLQRLRR